MTLLAFNLPDDPTRTAGWLEEQLVGLELPSLVAQLAAVHELPPAPAETAAEPADFDVWLGEHRPAVLSQGLSALPPDKLRELLRHPLRLFALQELVLIEGGRHWDEVPRQSPLLEQRFSTGKSRLQQFLAAPAAGPASVTLAPAPAAGRRSMWASALAMAACLLVAVFFASLWFTDEAPWGWNGAGALAANVPAPDYLNRLADEAQEWFARRPATAADLQRRLRQLRQGCDRLIADKHPPLTAADRDWLVERCQKWRVKFDEQLAAIAKGEDPLKVRNQTDETVNKLIVALRGHAKELQAG